MSLSYKKNYLLIIITVLIAVNFIQYADATQVNNIPELRSKINNILLKGVMFLADIAAVGGFYLFFVGVWGLYNSHVKAQSGGKPMIHNVLMLATGAILVSIPVFLNVFSTGLLGSGGYHQFSDTGDISQIVTNANS